MAAEYKQPKDVVKRVRFFDGQYLQDQDFVDEQHYQIDRQRRHNRTLHVAGIAEGLGVTSVVGAAQVVVAAGTAVDADGRLLVVTDEPAAARTINLANYLGRTVNLYLLFQEVESNPQASGSADYGRWLEQPQFVVVDVQSTHEFALPPVLLGRVALNSQAVETVDDSVRVYSGLRLPGPAADAPTLRTAASGLVGLTGSLTVDGNVGIGTTAPGAKLDINASTTTAGGWNEAIRLSQPSHSAITHPGGGLLFGLHSDRNFYFADIKDGFQKYVMTVEADTGNVGIGTTGPGAKLEVAGDIKFTGDSLKTAALGRITPLYLRGSGLNNNSPRMLILGSTTVYNVSSGRGLTLTILKKSDHSLVSTATYDTFASTANSDTLATALNGVTKEQIGFLSSYDAWENAISDNLRTALRRVGLYKAAITPVGSRRPYAALFEASSSATVGTAKAVEVLYSTDANAPFAEIRGWLMDGSFVAAASAPNALTNSLGTEPVVIVNEANNVGIGITSPAQKLIVAGAHNAGKDADSGMTSAGQFAIKGNAPQIDFIDTDHNDWSIHVNSNKLYFIRQPWEHTDLVLDGAGNVGIGTASPGAKVEIAAPTSGIALKVGRRGGQPSIKGVGDWLILDGPDEGQLGLNYWAKGNVNIAIGGGATILGGGLSVAGNLSFGSTVRQMINLWSTGYGIGVQSSTQYFRTGQNFAWYKGGSHNDGELNAGTNGTVQMVIKDGNVGIGTASPDNKLEVNGAIEIEVDNADSKLRFHDPGNAWYSMGIDQSDGGQFKLNYGGNIGDSNHFVMTSGGKVGIGITNPAQRLIVAGAHNDGKDPDSGMSSAGQLAIKGNAPQLDFIDTDHNDWSIHVNSHKLYFIRQPWNYSDLVLDGNGNVGIGTDGPRQKLDVNGWIRISGGSGLQLFKSDGSQNWAIYPEWGDAGDPDLFFHFSGNTSGWASGWLEPYGSGWRNNSDERLKEDIAPLQHVLDGVMKLSPKSYRFINSETKNRKSIGFVAQNVEQIFPDLVSEKHGYKSLNYGEFAVLAIAAIQEQQSLIENLQKKIEALQ